MVNVGTRQGRRMHGIEKTLVLLHHIDHVDPFLCVHREFDKFKGVLYFAKLVQNF